MDLLMKAFAGSDHYSALPHRIMKRKQIYATVAGKAH